VSHNRHDTWQRFCTRHAAWLADTGIPESVTRNEHRFRDLLCEGTTSRGDVTVLLTALSDVQWSALEGFATVFFREFESYAPLDLFLAFRREIERRRTEFSARWRRSQ
jgi:hypothetical protein